MTKPQRARRARVLVAVLVAFAGFVVACRTESERPRNLLILSVDTLRADAIGASGYSAARTPNIDRLAVEGTYFVNAISTMPRTTPALGSLLTGLWPHHHGSREVGDPILDVPTLAELLRDRGFATLAVSSNATAGPREKLDKGFQHFVSYERLIDTYGKHLYRDRAGVAPENPGWATVVNVEGIRLLATVPDTEPWFLWLFYYDPHLLYLPPAPWQEVAAAGCREFYEYYNQNRGLSGEIFADVGGVASRALEECRRLYDAEISYVDHEIGKLLGTLEELGMLGDTLVVFTADHGENFGEWGLYFQHGDNAHGAGLRVPLIFRGPGIAAGRRDHGAVSLVDVMPTVASLLGLDPGEVPRSDGLDLSDRLLAGSRPPARPRSRVVFAESANSLWNHPSQLVTGRKWWRVCINGERFSLCERPRDEPGVYTLFDYVADPRFENDLAARYPEVVEGLLRAWENWPHESARQRVAATERFKLVQTPRLEGGYDSRLYDLESDPQESVDVRAEHPDVYRHLVAEIERWSSGFTVAPVREYDPELEEKLRSLGYVE